MSIGTGYEQLGELPSTRKIHGQHPSTEKTYSEEDARGVIAFLPLLRAIKDLDSSY